MTWDAMDSMTPETKRRLAELAECARAAAHGRRARYMAGCRCLECRAANARYESERRAARERGDWNGLVDAKPARAHLRRLSRAGVGYKQVAAAADVAASVVQKILNGARTRIRARTARRLLAVDAGAAADGARIRVERTRARIEVLLEQGGFTRAELARRLGRKSAQLPLGRTVTVRKAEAVRRLFAWHFPEHRLARRL